MPDFDLDDDDAFAVEVAKDIARRLLRDRRTTPIQIVGLGHALYALERMPASTSGALTEFGIEYRRGSDNFEEMKYIVITISEEFFEISTGGSVYDSAVGSDSLSGPVWLVEVDGHKSRNLELHDLESQIATFLELGARIEVEDESEIDVSEPER